METNANQQIEIDLLFLLKKIWNRKFFITLIASLFGTLALATSLFLIKPQYTSTTRIYVVNQNGNSDSLTTQDLQVGDYLVKDYREIILSKDVLTKVSSNALDEGLSSDAIEGLNKKVSVNSPANTRVISISVSNSNPKVAAYLANKVREESALKIKEVTKVEDVTTLEVAEPEKNPSSPNIKRNVLLGLVLGGFIAVTGVLVKELLDDRVKRPEDVEEVLGITLLGIIPNEGQL